MNSSAAVSSLFNNYATGIALHTKEATQLQDMLSRLIFGTPLQYATPLQLQSLQLAAATAINPSGMNPLGLTDGGALFSDTYSAIVGSGGLSLSSGSHVYGHSPQAMAAASGIMARVATTAQGSSLTDRGIGGSTKLATGVINQMIRREGLGTLGGTETLTRQNGNAKPRGMIEFLNNTVYHHKGMTRQEQVAIASQELGGEMYARLLKKVASKRTDADWLRAEGLTSAMHKLENLDIENYDNLDEETRVKIDEVVMKFAKGEEGKEVKESILREAGSTVSLDLLNDAKVSLDDHTKLRAAREAARGKNSYTVLNERAAESIKAAQRRQLEVTGEMSEVFGTDDANKLLEIANLFGVRTLDAERDVTEMKRVMDAARARAESTGRSLADVMGEMQGIAAVGAQALGRFGVSSAFLQHAVSQTQVSDASRAAGLDFRTPEQVQASLVAEEHNFQNNNLNWMYAYEHIKKNKAVASEADLKWLQEVEDTLKKGELDDATSKAWERRGAAYNAKNAHNVSVEQMQKAVTEGTVMTLARTSYQKGNVEDNLMGHAADILKGARVGGSYNETSVGRALFGKDTGVYKDLATQAEQEKAFTTDISILGRQYGGNLKRFQDDYAAVKDFNSLSGTDREKAISEWKTKKIDKARDLGATADQIEEITASLDALIKFSKSAGGDVAASNVMSMLRGHTLNNYTGTLDQLEQQELHLASQRKAIGGKFESFAAEGAGYSQFNKRGDSTVDGLIALSTANYGSAAGTTLLDQHTGTFNVANINNFDPSKSTARGYEAAKYMAHTFAVGVDADGKLNFDDTINLAASLEKTVSDNEATIGDLEAKIKEGKATEEEKAAYSEVKRAEAKLATMRSTFQIADGQAVSAGLGKMTDKQMELALYDAENRSHSVMRDRQGNIVIGARNESQTDAINAGIQEQQLYDAAIMGIGGIEQEDIRNYVVKSSAAAIYKRDEDGNIVRDADGKAVLEEGASYDMASEDGRNAAAADKTAALAALNKDKSFAFVSRAMEAAGTTHITEASGMVTRKNAKGEVIAYKLSDSDERSRLITDAMDSNMDYQKEVKRQAEEGNADAITAEVERGLRLSRTLNEKGKFGEARRSHIYGISEMRNDRLAELGLEHESDAMTSDETLAENRVNKILNKMQALDDEQKSLRKQRASGKMSEAAYTKAITRVNKELKEATASLHKESDYTFMTDEELKLTGGKRYLTREEADARGYEEQLDQMWDSDARGAELVRKDMTNAMGPNAAVEDEKAKKAAEEEKLGIFKDWNRQFTKPEGHGSTNSTMLAGLQVLSASGRLDDGEWELETD